MNRSIINNATNTAEKGLATAAQLLDDGFPLTADVLTSACECIVALIADAQQGAEPVAWFPLLGTPFAIKRAMLNEQQAMRNHSQTLDRLAERGGLSPQEAWANFKHDRNYGNGIKQQQAFADLIAAAPATGAPR